MTKEYYDEALICKNGHLITGSYKIKTEERVDYCGDCGAETIHKCQHCQQVIKGDKYRESNMVTLKNELFNDFNNPDIECMASNSEIYAEKCKPELVETASVPAFCSNCGKAFPWTITKLRKKADNTTLNDEEKETLKKLLTKIADDKNNAKAILDEEKNKYEWLKSLGDGFWKAVGEILPGVLMS